MRLMNNQLLFFAFNNLFLILNLNYVFFLKNGFEPITFWFIYIIDLLWYHILSIESSFLVSFPPQYLSYILCWFIYIIELLWYHILSIESSFLVSFPPQYLSYILCWFIYIMYIFLFFYVFAWQFSLLLLF